MRAMLTEFEHKSGDEVIGSTIPKLTALLVALSDDLDRAQQKVIRRTWALFWLTLVLAIIGAAPTSCHLQARSVIAPCGRADSERAQHLATWVVVTPATARFTCTGFGRALPF